jgi:hypothetical protein
MSAARRGRATQDNVFAVIEHMINLKREGTTELRWPDLRNWCREQGLTLADPTLLKVATRAGIKMRQGGHRLRGSRWRQFDRTRALGICIRALYESLGVTCPPLVAALATSRPLDNLKIADAYPEGKCPADHINQPLSLIGESWEERQKHLENGQS